MKKLLLSAAFTMLFFGLSFSQIPSYTFNSSTETYTPITGGTVLVSGFYDTYNSAPISLSFSYNCTPVSSIRINADGHIALGTYISTVNYTPLSSTINASIGILSVFGRDMASSDLGSPEIRYETVGNEFVVQWTDARRSGTTGERINYQVRINTVTNAIKYVYGSYTAGIANSNYPEIGLKGVNNVFATNIKNVTLACGATGWLGMTAGTANNSKVCLSSPTVPASGTSITWTPPSVPTPAAITGTTAQCPALTGQVYSVPAVAGATTYTWTVPTGWTITAGAGTTSITVTTGAAGQNGNISVTASSACGTSAASTTAVTVGNDTPSTPGTITGSAAQCPGVLSQTYSITAVPNATTYTWTVPVGWTITAGAGTNSITVTSGGAGQNGNITVTAGNACGTSAAATKPVTVSPATPATPGTITGTATQCPALTGQTYTITAVPNATTYTWTVPVGWSITAGAGTNSITVTTGATAQNGNITVTAGNTCGTSAAATKPVTVGNGTPATPGTITGTATQCPALTGQTYSITAVPNATTYTWTVPVGWSITAGVGTNSITVTSGATGQNGNITVTAGNACGTSSAATSAVTVGNGTPATPGTITGLAAQCPALTGQTYSITAVPNATTYTWTVPVGWAITAGAGTNSITVTSGGAGQNGNITVTAGNACGTSAAATKPVTVSPATPATPGTITGTATQCPALTGQTYSIAAVSNATTYTWTVPVGWTITAGAGTNSITVTTGATSQNGNITVTAGNSCGTSAAATSAVTVGNGTPATPGTITGTTAQCPGVISQTYSITAVPNATTYTWTVPVGWTITAGAGTNSITVTSGGAGQNGNITVTAGNACGTSAAATKPVTVSPATPATPGTITGTATQCPALTGQTYSITAVPNATTYTWTVPVGWTITAGAGTNSITVTTGATGQNGNITVTAGNSCGTSSAATSAVTVGNGTPATPGTITGTATQCPALTGQTYSITAVPNATTYTWTVPVGWSITAGAGTNSITVTSGGAGQNGNITVTAGNACGTSAVATKPVTVSPATPATPGTITGTATQCPALTGQTYSITAVPNATTYTWTVPVGWSITAGAGTNSITVTSGGAGQNGNITVTAGNACGTSAAATSAVTVGNGTPATPGTITGTTAQCPGVISQIYSITAVPNATTYTWTVPVGWTITAGAATNSITVTSGGAGQNGNITVTAGNACGTSAAATKPVTVSPATPATPGTITGTATQCPALTGQTYSIAAVSNATTYTWTVPVGWTITAGAGTNSITVTTGATAQNGNITVTAGNSCGTSAAAISAVTVGNGTPATPGAITGTATQCPALTGQTYSIAAVPNATTYTWTVPAGWSITAGAGTNSITVTSGGAGQNGNITVTAGNACGTSSAATSAVTVANGTPATPGTITGLAAQCPGVISQTYSITAVPNATTYTWTVPVGWAITAGAGTNSITVTSGGVGQNGNITVTAGNSCGTSSVATKPVTVSPATPATPGTITGTATQCPALTGQTYSIVAVSNATTYTWTVPVGWSITAGAGTNSITVTAGATGQNGDITVTAGNSCGTSTAASLAVTVENGTPAVPGVISGTAAQCPAITGQTYSIAAVSNATTYTWTVPAGWSITAGAGTNSITVTTGATGQNGDITVTAGNSCGTSTAATLAVTVENGTPESPGSIAGNATICSDATTQTYSVPAVANATTYIWTVPAGWAITTGAGSTSITVTTGAAGQNGDITVTAGNGCGTSTAAALAVVINPIPQVNAGNDTTVCVNYLPIILTASGNSTSYSWSNGSAVAATTITAGGTYTVTGTLNGCSASDAIIVTVDPCVGLDENDNFFISLYPNPTSNILKIETNTTESDNFSVYSIDGKLITTGFLVNGKSEIVTMNFAPGKYFIHLGQNVSTFEVMN
jgi:hypothetical protein